MRKLSVFLLAFTALSGFSQVSVEEKKVNVDGTTHLGADREDQVVVSERLSIDEHGLTGEVDARDFAQQNAGVLVLGEHAADGRGDLGGAQARHRHLVKERLEQVVVLAVDHGHADLLAAQLLRGDESPEACAHDDDVRFLAHVASSSKAWSDERPEVPGYFVTIGAFLRIDPRSTRWRKNAEVPVVSRGSRSPRRAAMAFRHGDARRNPMGPVETMVVLLVSYAVLVAVHRGLPAKDEP